MTMAWVPAPPARPPLAGLIASLGPVGGPYLDPTDEWASPALPPLETARPQPTDADPAVGAPVPQPAQEWERGFQYQPEMVCGGGGVTDPCNTDMDPPPEQPDSVEAEAFVVWTGDRCSSFGWKGHDFVGRVTRGLLAVESFYIAQELWTGTQAGASGWPNPVLASAASDVLTNGAVSPAQALACLEQGVAAAGKGQRGAIHCTPQLGLLWSELGSTLRTADGLIMTYRGTVIIPDAGYDGSGPSGADATDGHQWAYGTLLPQVRRGAVHYTPASYAEALSRSVNTITWLAWRAAAATFPACVHVAAEVDVPLCLTGGVS